MADGQGAEEIGSAPESQPGGLSGRLHSAEAATNLTHMRLLIVTWPYAVVYWGVVIWAYLPEVLLSRRAPKVRSTQDAGSYLVVMMAQGLALAIGFVIAFAGRFGTLQQPRLWFWLGVAGMVAGSLLRHHCFRMLGKSFTAVVAVAPDQAVVERGAYRWVRHPSYTAGVLMLGGQILALGNWVALAVVLCAVFAGYFYRIRVEERALLETIGEPYRAYMRRTKRFVPMII
jgi:protein-S-isoprenylcysteine O-methyltransferase Ste14